MKNIKITKIVQRLLVMLVIACILCGDVMIVNATDTSESVIAEGVETEVSEAVEEDMLTETLGEESVTCQGITLQASHTTNCSSSHTGIQYTSNSSQEAITNIVNAANHYDGWYPGCFQQCFGAANPISGAWCAKFVKKAAADAGIASLFSTGSEDYNNVNDMFLIMTNPNGPYKATGYVMTDTYRNYANATWKGEYLFKYAQQVTASTFTPQAGDVIFINSSSSATAMAHVGLVYKVSGNLIYYIDGNGGGTNRVRGKSFNLWISKDASRLAGFMRPNYAALDAVKDTTAPVISDVKVSVDGSGYTISCVATDDVGVTAVRFPTWTTYNNQDDLAPVYPDGVYKDGRWEYRVNISDHNNEFGEYTTHIYAYDASGKWSQTGWVCEVLPIPATPYKITNVVSGAHVYWNTVSGVSQYGLWRSETGENGTYEWIANPTVPHFTDTNVQSGKTYYYKVTTCNAATNAHSEKSGAIGITYVSTPDIIERMNLAAGVKLTWNEIAGATGYAIYRKTGTESWVRVKTITGNETFTWTDTAVKANNGTTYKYTVRALAGSDLSTLSGCRSTGRTMVRLTSRTLNSAVKTSSTSIKCNWTTSSVVTGYEVRFMVGSTIYKQYTIGNYKTGVKTFTGLKVGQTYKVQVRSYKKVSGIGGFYSAWSTPIYVKL